MTTMAEGDSCTASSVPPSCWIGSANWDIGYGSLRDLISYDCSSPQAGYDGVAESGGVLLLKPEGLDPCEVTVCFRGKHEIRRVYVRSTARVYEIYYVAEEPHSNNEYLCTVRCGAAATEVMLPKINEGQIVERQNPRQSSNLSENNVSDDDGWIDVKIPESQIADDRKDIIPKESDINAASNLQVCYEATAEISDLSPCVSLTLRLLSIQSQGCIYIDEIYIYADPIEIESTDSGPSTSLGSNIAGSSLLSMLVPSLLQLSKNENNRRSASCGLSDPANEDGALSNARTCDPEFVAEEIPEVTLQTFPNPAAGGESPVEFKASDTPQDSSSVGKFCNPVREDSNGYHHVEKVLNELVSRVGRIESFCSRFEEHIMCPLGSMEIRLQRMEKQLDALTLRTCCHETFPYSKNSASEFSFHEADSMKRDCDTTDAQNQNVKSSCPPAAECSAASVLDSNVNPGLIVTAPEFSQDSDSLISSCSYIDSAGKHFADNNISLYAGYESPDDICHYDNFNECFNSMIKDIPGDNGTSTEFLDVDAIAGSNGSSYSIEKSSPKPKRPFSIETALTSELEAFMSSAALKSSGQDTSPGEPENEGEKKDGTVDNPSFLSEGVQNSVIDHFLSQESALEDRTEQRVHDIDQSCLVTQETLSCDHSHMERSENSCGILIRETIGCNFVNKEWIRDNVSEDAKSLHEGQAHREWIENSDTESSEGTNIDQVNWTDESSAASRNEEFPPCNWLAGRQAQLIDEETEKTDCSTANLHCSSGCPDHEKSKIEIERDPKSAFDDEDFVFSEKISFVKVKEEPLLEVLLGEKYNLKDDDHGSESEQKHFLSQHNLDPVAQLYDDHIHGVFQELLPNSSPVNIAEEMVKEPPVCIDTNTTFRPQLQETSVSVDTNTTFRDQLLVDVGDFPSTGISSNVQQETLSMASVFDHKQSFNSLI